jgi:hypothetical protein
MIILPMASELHSRTTLFRLQKEWDEKRKKPREKHKNGKQELPETTAQSDNRVAGTEINADEGEGSGTKRKSPVPSAGGKSDEKHVEPGAGQRGGGADKPMERRRGTTLKLINPRHDDEAGTECPELIFHLDEDKTTTIQLETELPWSELIILSSDNIRWYFDVEQDCAFVIETRANATATRDAVYILHKSTLKLIGVVRVNIRISTSGVVEFSQQPEPETRSNLAILGLEAEASPSETRSNLAILGLEAEASPSAIRDAYHQRLKSLHSDKTGVHSAQAAKELHDVLAAYDALRHRPQGVNDSIQHLSMTAGGTST